MLAHAWRANGQGSRLTVATVQYQERFPVSPVCWEVWMLSLVWSEVGTVASSLLPGWGTVGSITLVLGSRGRALV